MNSFDPVFSIFGEVIVAGGGGALVTFLALRAFGRGWLDSYFSAKSITLKAEHDAAAARLKAEQDTALAELKRVHDAALKDVQAVIDKDLHRARKLYDLEFEALAEAWKLLVKAFDTTHSTIASFPVKVAQMNEKELIRAFEVFKFEHWQIDQVLANEDLDEREYLFNKIIDQKRLFDYREYRLEFARYLVVNAVFMPDGFKERFNAVDALITAALVEFDVRINHTIKYNSSNALMNLAEQGKPLLDALEMLIHERMRSADVVRRELVD